MFKKEDVIGAILYNKLGVAEIKNLTISELLRHKSNYISKVNKSDANGVHALAREVLHYNREFTHNDLQRVKNELANIEEEFHEYYRKGKSSKARKILSKLKGVRLVSTYSLLSKFDDELEFHKNVVEDIQGLSDMSNKLSEIVVNSMLDYGDNPDNFLNYMRNKGIHTLLVYSKLVGFVNYSEIDCVNIRWNVSEGNHV